jgi:hypothetical protein
MSHRQLHLNKLQISLRTPFSAQEHDCGYALYSVREMRDGSTGITDLDTVRDGVKFELTFTDAYIVLLRRKSISRVKHVQYPPM